jgi:hypothetical protein
MDGRHPRGRASRAVSCLDYQRVPPVRCAGAIRVSAVPRDANAAFDEFVIGENAHHVAARVERVNIDERPFA